MHRILSIIILSTLLVVSACGPIYETRRNYIAPKSQQGIACISNCSMNKHSCISQCNAQRHSCMILDESRARSDYEDYMRTHCSEVTDTHSAGHIPGVQTIPTLTTHSRKHLSCQHDRTMASFRHTEHCDSSFNACSQGCLYTHDECYIGCGGKVDIFQVCVAFCNR